MWEACEWGGLKVGGWVRVRVTVGGSRNPLCCITVFAQELARPTYEEWSAEAKRQRAVWERQQQELLIQEEEQARESLEEAVALILLLLPVIFSYLPSGVLAWAGQGCVQATWADRARLLLGNAFAAAEPLTPLHPTPYLLHNSATRQAGC